MPLASVQFGCRANLEVTDLFIHLFFGQDFHKFYLLINCHLLINPLELVGLCISLGLHEQIKIL